MRKLYQILYNVGRLTDAPERRAFPFWGTLGQWAGLRGGKHSELRSPFFPLALPLSGHVAVLRCGMEECIGKCLYASVLAVPMVCTGRKAVCVADLFLAVVVSLA